MHFIFRRDEDETKRKNGLGRRDSARLPRSAAKLLRSLSRSSKDVNSDKNANINGSNASRPSKLPSRRSQSFSGRRCKETSSTSKVDSVNSGAKSILLTEDNLAALDSKNKEANGALPEISVVSPSSSVMGEGASIPFNENSSISLGKESSHLFSTLKEKEDLIGQEISSYSYLSGEVNLKMSIKQEVNHYSSSMHEAHSMMSMVHFSSDYADYASIVYHGDDDGGGPDLIRDLPR